MNHFHRTFTSWRLLELATLVLAATVDDGFAAIRRSRICVAEMVGKPLNPRRSSDFPLKSATTPASTIPIQKVAQTVRRLALSPTIR